MLETYMGGWQSLTAAYFADAASVLGGNYTALSVTAAAGIVLLVVGLIIAVAQRVTRAGRLIVPAILTLLWPILVLYIENTIAWLGRIFHSIFGVGALLIWVGLIVGKAPNKLPIWLIGLGLVSFVAYFGLVTLVPLLL
jgi:hypothetical protein